MTQRSYANDRNRKGAKVGSTRKSASSAKPVRKQGSVEVSSSGKSDAKAGAKSDKSRIGKDGIERDFAGLPTSPEIKKWRRIWWMLLLGGLAMIGGSYLVPEFRTNEQVLKLVSLGVLLMSGAAIGIDFVIIRRLRKALMEKPKKGAK